MHRTDFKTPGRRFLSDPRGIRQTDAWRPSYSLSAETN